MNIEELKSLQLNIIRKNKKCNLVGISIIGILVGISIFFLLSINIMPWYTVPIVLFTELVFFTIMFIVIKNLINGKDIVLFRKEYKNVFVLKSLKRFFDNVKYNPEKGISKKYIDSIGLLDTGDRFSSNDYISGYYKNVKFEQSDIHIEEKHIEEDDDGNKEVVWETIFEGRLMIFDFNKKFKSSMCVMKNQHSIFNRFLCKKGFSNVKMEDVEFNKDFSVYAESEHEAFYILTPHFMKKIKYITKNLNGEVMFGFKDSRLYVTINNGEDAFEYNVLKPINEQEIEEELIKDIRVITDFVDELNLDNTLFKNMD